MSHAPEVRPLGHSGLKTSTLWLGSMMFGDQTNEAEAASIVDAARDAGLNAIDTADVYANGESERIVGRLMAADRARWVLASKAANQVGKEPNDRGLSRRWLTHALDASLLRLNTEWIDLWYLHRDDDITPVEETVDAIGRLIASGKILYWGVSNFRAWRVARIAECARRLGVPGPIACQPPYNAMTRGIETELLPACAHYGLGVAVYSPLGRGVLTGKYAPDAVPEAGTRAARQDTRLMQTEWRPESLVLAQRFAVHARSRGVPPSQMAIAWALHNRLVHSVIGGPRTLAQWQDYIAALRVQLTDEDERVISGLVPAGHSSTYGYTDPIYPVTGRQPR